MMPIDINKYYSLIVKMPCPSEGGPTLNLAFGKDTAKRWGVVFLQRIKTPNGLGTVIGEYKDRLWIWLDDNRGVSRWEVKDNLFSMKGFEPVKKPSMKSYPDEVEKYIENLFQCSINELVTFTQNPFLLIFGEESKQAIEAIEKNWGLWLEYTTTNLNTWSNYFTKYLQEHSQNPLEKMQQYGELTSRVTGIPKITIKEFNLSYAKEIKEVEEQIFELQQQKSSLLEQTTAKEDQEQIKGMFKNLEQVLHDKLEQLNKLEEQNRRQKMLTSQLNKVLTNQQFAEFNQHAKRIELTVNSLLAIKPQLQDKHFMKTYQAMLTLMAQYLYEQDLIEKQSEATDKTGKEEAEANLSPDLFTGLVFAMVAGDSTIKKAYYLRLINRLDNNNNAAKEMPVTFDLEIWAVSNPQQMINLCRFLFNNSKFKQFEEGLSYKEYPLFIFEIVKLKMSFILALNEVQKNNSKFSIPQEIKFHAQKTIDLLVDLILDGNEEIAIWAEKQIKGNKNPFIKNYRVYAALAEFYATPPHVNEEKGLFFYNEGKTSTKDPEENKQAKLVSILYEAIHGSTGEIRRAAVELLNQKREYHYLKLVGHKNPDAALLCLDYCLANNQLDEAKQYITLARKADRAKAAYFEALLVDKQKGDFMPFFLEAIELGFAHAGYALRKMLSVLLEKKQIEEINERYLNLLNKPFVLNILTVPVIKDTIMAVYNSTGDTQQQEEFREKWMFNLLVVVKNTEIVQKTDLVVTLITECRELLSDEGLLVALSILSKQRYFDEPGDPFLLDAIAQIITEQDKKGPKHFFNLGIYDFLKNNTKLVVLLMNNSSSKERLAQCERFTSFIKKEQIRIEESDKVKNQPSLANLGLFGDNNNLPEEKGPSPSPMGTKKG
ncbi:TPA: coiled-coil domain-containing protein [Legionella pneumophila]